MRNLKALGLALVAVLALGGVYASAASAQQGKLPSDGPFTLTGVETGAESNNQLEAFGVAVRCPGSEYTGHVVTTHAQTTAAGKSHEKAGTGSNLIPIDSSTATITPHYKETTPLGPPNCSAPVLGWSATVDLNGCDYVIHIGNTVSEHTYNMTFDIVCPIGNEITVTLWKTEAKHTSGTKPTCIMHIPPQNGLAGGHATDTNTRDGHIELTDTVEGVTVKKVGTNHDPSILCIGTSHESDSKIKLDVTVAAHDVDGDPQPINLTHD